MIDRSLNCGRCQIAAFLKMLAPFDAVLDFGAGHGDDWRKLDDVLQMPSYVL